MTAIPLYDYQARTEQGQKETGAIEAPSRAAATVRLRQRGLWIERLEERRARPLGREVDGAAQPARRHWCLFYGLVPVTPGALGHFFEQLGGLYRAGVPMQTIVTETAPRVSSPRLRKVLQEAAPSIGAGASLSDCLASYPQIFPAGVVGLLRVGEVTGNLDEIARDLADGYHAEQRVWWWLLAPKLYFGFCLLLAAVVPSFPWFISRGLSWWIDHLLHQVLPLIGLVVGAYLVGRIVWHLPPMLRARDVLAYYVPGWRALTKRAGLARFYRALEVCVRAGVDFATALDTAAGAAGNALMVARLKAAASRVRAGMPLHEALRPTGFISPQVEGMLSSAALGGTFDEVLPRMARQARDSWGGMVKALRIGALVMAYLLTGAVVVYAVGMGYLALFQARMEAADLEGLLE